jgi:phosphate transport system protein
MAIHLQSAIEKLKHHMLSLSAVVEENVYNAVHAFEEGDADLAMEVISKDEEIDKMEVDLEEECLKILALYQPVANDLRFIIAVLKINSDLERIGDLSVNVAERALYMSKVQRPEVPFKLYDMAELTREMLRKALDALVNKDSALALKVCAMDDKVDAINRDIYDYMKSLMKTNADEITQLLHVVSASRHLERIADHATNIAEDVIYLIEGKIIRHKIEEFEADHE